MAETPTLGNFRFFVIERKHTGPITCKAGPYMDAHMAQRERKKWALLSYSVATYDVIETDNIDAYLQIQAEGSERS
jgi:hypothetical protein